jgi:hypothetical protein
MIIRWSFWGDKKNTNVELLYYSILTFQKYFGPDHIYLVYTDDSEYVNEHIKGIARVEHYPVANTLFNFPSIATWKKWCPVIRIDQGQTEMYVDSDVFLVNYPVEIENFLNDGTQKFAILDEFKGQPWQHGAMKVKATANTPFVNAGLFIQKVLTSPNLF